MGMGTDAIAYVWASEDAYGCQFSHSIMWFLSLNTGCRTWQQTPLLTEPSLQPSAELFKHTR